MIGFQFSEDIPKPPSEPAPIAKESQLIEDEAPWRRPTSIRLNRTNQHENPPKIRKYWRLIAFFPNLYQK